MWVFLRALRDYFVYEIPHGTKSIERTSYSRKAIAKKLSSVAGASMPVQHAFLCNLKLLKRCFLGLFRESGERQEDEFCLLGEQDTERAFFGICSYFIDLIFKMPGMAKTVLADVIHRGDYAGGFLVS